MRKTIRRQNRAHSSHSSLTATGLHQHPHAGVLCTCHYKDQRSGRRSRYFDAVSGKDLPSTAIARASESPSSKSAAACTSLLVLTFHHCSVWAFVAWRQSELARMSIRFVPTRLGHHYRAAPAETWQWHFISSVRGPTVCPIEYLFMSSLMLQTLLGLFSIRRCFWPLRLLCRQFSPVGWNRLFASIFHDHLRQSVKACSPNLWGLCHIPEMQQLILLHIGYRCDIYCSTNYGDFILCKSSSLWLV